MGSGFRCRENAQPGVERHNLAPFLCPYPVGSVWKREQRGLGVSLPFTCVVPLYCLLSGFTFNQVRTLDSLFENETLLALVPSPSAAGTPSLALAVGGSLGGRGPSAAVAGPASGFAPQAEAMARPLGAEAGSPLPVTARLIFHARRHPFHAELPAPRI